MHRAAIVLAATLAGCSSVLTPATRTTSPPSVEASATGVAEPGKGFPAQPEGIPFPTEAWPVGDWPAGVDRTALDRAVRRAFNGGGQPRVRAVLVVHGGRIVYERYSSNTQDGPTAVMRSFSIAKSITSALVGILVQKGRLTVDAPAPVPGWERGDPRADITIDNLLHMSSGLKWVEDSARPDSDLIRAITSRDAAAYAADRPLAHDPGSEFLHSGADTFLLNRIVAGEVGSGRESREYLATGGGSDLALPVAEAILDAFAAAD